MTRLFAVPAALALFAAPAVAQDADGDAMARAAERMADPAQQQQTALMLRAMGEVLLDMPLAPLMDAMAEIAPEAKAADMPQVDRDATLRRLVPGADRMPELVERAAPQAMQAMSGMADHLDTALPALRDMARRLQQSVSPQTASPAQ